MNLATRPKEDGDLAESGGAEGSGVFEEGDACLSASLSFFYLFIFFPLYHPANTEHPANRYLRY